MNKIQITGNEENKDRACGVLMRINSDTVHCLEDEIYIVSDKDLKRLEESEIKFIKLDSGNSLTHDANAQLNEAEKKNG